MKRIPLLISMLMMTAPVQAKEEQPQTTDFVLQKTIQVREKTTSPMTEFHYSITPEAGFWTDPKTQETKTAEPGPNEGIGIIRYEDLGGFLYPNYCLGSFSPTLDIGFDRDIVQETGQPNTTQYDPDKNVYFKSVTMTVNEIQFLDAPEGIYRYRIAEEEGSYDGMEYSEQAYFIDVHKQQDPDNADSFLYSVTLSDADSLAKAGKLEFISDFSKPTGNTGTREVTISERTTGNLGEANKSFEYRFWIDGDEQETFNYQKGSEQMQTAASDDKKHPQSVWLEDGESLHIYGLSKHDEIHVWQAAPHSEGYMTSAAEFGAGIREEDWSEREEVKTGEDQIVVAEMDTDRTVLFENRRESGVMTGLCGGIHQLAIEMMGCVLAGGLACLSRRRSKRVLDR